MTDINWGLAGRMPDYASGAINAFRAGREDRKARVEENAFAKFGQDPNGAINELMAVNPDAAMKLRQQGQQDGDRQSRITGATALANNDYKGAAAAYAGTGDAASVMSANAAQADRLEKQHQYMRTIAPGLEKYVNEGGDAAKAFEGAIPILKQLGVEDDAIANLQKGFQTDPKSTVAGIMATAQKKISYHNSGDTLFVTDDATGDILATYQGNRYIAVPDGGKLVPTGGMGGMGGAPGGPSAAPAQGQAGGFDGFYSQYLAPAEGGYAANDGNGAPVNFGINQKSNPDVDVSKLTQEQAKQLTYERYWKPSGADKLPPGLAEVHADTAFNMGLEPAQRLLQASGRDAGKYFQLREQRYRSIAAANPDKAKYLPTWLDRNEQLRSYVNGQGGAGRPAPTQQAQAGSRGMNERGDPVGTIYGSPKAGMGEPPPESGLKPIGGGFYRDTIGRTYQRNGNGVMQQSAGVTDGAVAKTTEAIMGVNSILASVDRFDRAARQLKPSEFGPQGKYTGRPEVYAAAKAAATDLMMQLKSPSGYNLGVITGPDMAILEGVVSDPAKFDTMIRQGQIIPQLRQISMGLHAKNDSERQGFKAQGGDPAGLPPIYRPPAQSSRPKGWSSGLTPQQRQTAAKFRGATVAGGLEGNPFAPTSKAEYDALDPGVHYIHSSGEIRVKSK